MDRLALKELYRTDSDNSALQQIWGGGPPELAGVMKIIND
jgi:hypothetical protein